VGTAAKVAACIALTDLRKRVSIANPQQLLQDLLRNKNITAEMTDRKLKIKRMH
jgi:hypothetical protein